MYFHLKCDSIQLLCWIFWQLNGKGVGDYGEGYSTEDSAISSDHFSRHPSSDSLATDPSKLSGKTTSLVALMSLASLHAFRSSPKRGRRRRHALSLSLSFSLSLALFLSFFIVIYNRVNNWTSSVCRTVCAVERTIDFPRPNRGEISLRMFSLSCQHDEIFHIAVHQSQADQSIFPFLPSPPPCKYTCSYAFILYQPDEMFHIDAP